MALTRKWFYISIFTTNHFQVRRTKREIEREKEEIIELTPLTPILSLTSPPITELTHSRWAQPLDPLPHGSLITMSFLSLVDFFLSSTAFVYGFDGFTTPIHTPHLTSPPIYTAPTSPHLQPHLTSPHLRSTQLRLHLTSPQRFAWSPITLSPITLSPICLISLISNFVVVVVVVWVVAFWWFLCCVVVGFVKWWIFCGCWCVGGGDFLK